MRVTVPLYRTEARGTRWWFVVNPNDVAFRDHRFACASDKFDFNVPESAKNVYIVLSNRKVKEAKEFELKHRYEGNRLCAAAKKAIDRLVGDQEEGSIWWWVEYTD